MAPVAMSVAATQAGEYDTAVDEGARAEEVWRSIGGRFWSPIVKACMAESCLRLGRSDQAFTLIGEAVDQMESTGELMLAEEIYRVAGLVRLEHVEDQDGAKRLFEKSLKYSKTHGTRSFELRTSMSLAQLLDQQGKRRDARELLAPVYDWFTEGLETADLNKASALLDELS